MQVSTLCYLYYEDEVCMLYRNKKAHDLNQGKWIGVGGKLAPQETPREAIIREIKEETALEFSDLSFRGLLSFCYGNRASEYIFVYIARALSKDFGLCSEGDLAWVKQDDLLKLELWAGDKLFLPKLFTETEPFSLKLVYDEEDNLLASSWQEL